MQPNADILVLQSYLKLHIYIADGIRTLDAVGLPRLQRRWHSSHLGNCRCLVYSVYLYCCVNATNFISNVRVYSYLGELNMVKTGILRSLTISVKNVFGKSSKASANQYDDKTEEDVVSYNNNRLKYSSIICTHAVATICYEIGKDGYIKPI